MSNTIEMNTLDVFDDCEGIITKATYNENNDHEEDMYIVKGMDNLRDVVYGREITAVYDK